MSRSMTPIRPADSYYDGEITESELRHRRLFDTIFKKYDFINAAQNVIDNGGDGDAAIALVGRSLKDRYEGRLCGRSTIALVLLDWTGDLQWTHCHGRIS